MGLVRKIIGWSLILLSLLSVAAIIINFLASPTQQHTISNFLAGATVGIILFFIPLFVVGLELRKEPPTAPFRWGTIFFVTSLLRRGFYIHYRPIHNYTQWRFFWYFGYVALQAHNHETSLIEFKSLIDWIKNPQPGMYFLLHSGVDIVTSLISIILLYALVKKSRKLIRYLSLSLLLPFLGNLLYLLIGSPQVVLDSWFFYDFTQTPSYDFYNLVIRFGDFLMAASAIIFFRASRKVLVQAPPLPSFQFILCPNCGEMVSSTFSNCPHCNAPLPKP